MRVFCFRVQNSHTSFLTVSGSMYKMRGYWTRFNFDQSGMQIDWIHRTQPTVWKLIMKDEWIITARRPVKENTWSKIWQICTALRFHTKALLNVGGGHELVSGSSSPVRTPYAKCTSYAQNDQVLITTVDGSPSALCETVVYIFLWQGS